MAALQSVVRKAAFHLMKKQVAACCVPVRWLNLQEYQSKRLMADAGINVQKFKLAEDLHEAEVIAAAKDFKVDEYVIKAQILAGGRGKGTFDNGFKGGVHLTKNPADVPSLVEKMIGHKLVTKQTGKQGVMVKSVMVAEALNIERETYLAILMDREAVGPVLVGSPQGGMDIEEVARSSPDAIFKEYVDIVEGIRDDQANRMATNLGFLGDKHKQASDQIKKLYELFIKVDATQVEINPFGETDDGRVVCFDAKFNFDDNAAFRQESIFELDDMMENDHREREAAKWDLNYIGMDGNIGCLVNGAGLAMATMDIVKLHGGEPANFLDCGGGVTEQQVLRAFGILTSDPNVKAILVNIFGGIVNCETIAKGIRNACRNIELKIPLVVRLEGTNVDSAKRILRTSGLPITPADDFADAAEKAVQSLKQ
ncbi:succinate--CoA ligase [GDP-forming] subunit beta, mitochondrial-like isoform X1 [Lineus longissimus]|uniref:succinate--CoA ligase [GDP-forming] subunit beta, mitochondrial-like isoform X1 n=1 Tax=Lineus longissimus TaxID=88925 RepID=UPI002B4C8CAB